MLAKIINLFSPPKDPAAFTRETEARIQEVNAGCKTKIVEPLHIEVIKADETEPVQMFLQNVYTNYLQNRRHRKQLIEHYVQAMTSIEAAPILPKNVIPTIRDKNFLAEVAANIAARGGAAKREDFMVSEAYNEELAIVYAIDSPTAISYLNQEGLNELNLNGESLRSLAVDNLKRIVPEIEIRGAPPLFFVQAGNMFESSLILFDKLWNKEQFGIQGEIVIAIPSRETLLVADSQFPETIQKMRKVTAEIAKAAPYRLTGSLFVRREGKFEVFTG